MPVTQNHPPYWVWNHALGQLYLSTYHLTPANARLYFHIMRRSKIKYLLGYTSALHTLASAALEQNLQPPELTLAGADAQPVFDNQRQLITKAFGCPLRETYGMAELAVAASECESGRLHLWPEVGCVEVMQDGSPLQPGNTGDLIATGLLNQGMPLIRYRVGDRIRLARDGATCPCGRTLPLLDSLEGRCDDVLITSDGRLVGRLDSVFKSDFPIREAQIVQDRVDQVTVLVVPAQGFTVSIVDQLKRRLRHRLGAVHVKIQQVESIPRDANGKFRAVVCRIPAQNSPSSSRPGLSNG